MIYLEKTFPEPWQEHRKPTTCKYAYAVLTAFHIKNSALTYDPFVRRKKKVLSRGEGADRRTAHRPGPSFYPLGLVFSYKQMVLS